jgi:uncharacterized protein YutE (UPF0331/DUF86 family)
MIDDPALNKAAIIRRCLFRVRQEYRNDPRRLDDFTIQDSIILNLLRACEAAIDYAMHRVAHDRLGIPQTSRDAFDLLQSRSQLTPATAQAMKKMVGFRNIAVHSYQELQRPILEAILAVHLSDFETFLVEMVAQQR